MYLHMLWLLEVSVFSSLFWYVSDWWECADIVRYMNVSFCICEGWSLISVGRGTIDVSVSVAQIQFLKVCEATNPIENFTGSLGAHISVYVLVQMGSVENKGTFYRRLPLVVENGNLQFSFVLQSWCPYIHLCLLLPLCLCYGIDDIGTESLLIKI